MSRPLNQEERLADCARLATVYEQAWEEADTRRKALVDAIRECNDGDYCKTVAEYADNLYAALERRGLEIRSKNDD